MSLWSTERTQQQTTATKKILAICRLNSFSNCISMYQQSLKNETKQVIYYSVVPPGAAGLRLLKPLLLVSSLCPPWVISHLARFLLRLWPLLIPDPLFPNTFPHVSPLLRLVIQRKITRYRSQNHGSQLL